MTAEGPQGHQWQQEGVEVVPPMLGWRGRSSSSRRTAELRGSLRLCVCFVVAKVVEVVIVGLRRSEALYWNRGLVSLRLGCVAFFVEGSPVRVSVKPVTRKTDGCELCDDN